MPEVELEQTRGSAGGAADNLASARRVVDDRRADPAAGGAVGRQNLARAQISDAESVLECLRHLLTVLNSSVCQRHDLVVEYLLLRHQLAVLTRPTRTRPRARLRLWDKLHWVLARRSALAGVST